MNIRTLKLKNFQKHSNLTLELKDGINIIHGRSDVGKSAIRRSIEWCLFCENISGIQKEGTKQTSVTLVFDNGIELERIRSASVNRYILREGGEEKTWDKFGRDLPDEIKEKLNIQTIKIDDTEINLNISRQLDAPFLIGREHSGSFRMKLFNKLTGADLIDNVLKKLNIKIRKFNTDSKYATEQLEKNEEDLKKVTKQHTEKLKLYGILKSKYNKINKLQEKYHVLQEGEIRLKTCNENVTNVTEMLQNTQVIDTKGLRENIEKFETLTSLSEALICNDTNYIKAEHQVSKIIESSIDCGDLRGNIERFQALKDIRSELLVINTDIFSIDTSISANMIHMEDLILEKDKLVKEMPVCPVCKQEIK